MDLLGRSQVSQWAHTALVALQGAQLRLNEANVFPVADSDTGTNLVLTLQQGKQRVDALPADADSAQAMGTFALGALMGARGNSGIIASEFLRGFSLKLREGQDLAQCLTGAAESAFAAVAEPVPGTMLTAAHEAATAALEAQAAQQIDLGQLEVSAHPGALQVMLAACAGARRALRRSPTQLDVLHEQGVLDAGAYGLTMLLDALAQVLINESAEANSPDAVTLPDLPELVVDRADGSTSPAVGSSSDPDSAAACGHSHGDGEFEVMFLVEHHHDPKADLLQSLQQIGYSVVVVGGDGVWQVHVHTDNPAAALACVKDGQARQVCIRHLNDPTEATPVLRAPGIVAAVASPGLIPDIARAGAVVLMRGEQQWQSSEVERAVIDAGTERVVVLTREEDAAAVDELNGAASTRGVSIEVLIAPTDLHAVVALTAAAELLDAVPSSAGVSGRAGRKLVPAMAQAIADLGQTLSFDLGPTPPPADLQQQLSALTADAGLGLTLALHGEKVPAQQLQDIVSVCAKAQRRTELVLLESGLADTQVQIGTL